MQEFCTIFSGKIEHVPRADRSDHQGFNIQSKIVWRAGWRCKIENIIDRPGIEAQTDILFEKLEPRFGLEMSNILFGILCRDYQYQPRNVRRREERR